MNDERSNPHHTTPWVSSRPPLEKRLAHRPAVLAQMHRIADTLDESGGEGCNADQAEECVSVQVRQLAQEVLGQWAREANAHTQAQVSTQQPSAIRHGKKKR